MARIPYCYFSALGALCHFEKAHPPSAHGVCWVLANSKKLLVSSLLQCSPISISLVRFGPFPAFLPTAPQAPRNPQKAAPGPQDALGRLGEPPPVRSFFARFPAGGPFWEFFSENLRASTFGASLLIDGRRLRGWRWLTLTRPGWAPTSRDLRRSRSLSRSHDLSRRRPIS